MGRRQLYGASPIRFASAPSDSALADEGCQITHQHSRAKRGEFRARKGHVRRGKRSHKRNGRPPWRVNLAPNALGTAHATPLNPGALGQLRKGFASRLAATTDARPTPESPPVEGNWAECGRDGRYYKRDGGPVAAWRPLPQEERTARLAPNALGIAAGKELRRLADSASHATP